MDLQLPPLIRALLDPWRYPHGVQRVELVETHISWVLLAGEFAYKIKKPVRLKFLDFSTLAQRQACCHEELRLNRRFAPELYLEVVGIYNTPQDPRLDGPGAPIEFAVRMRRFDEASRLDHVCARGELNSAHLSNLAEGLTSFHAAAAVATADDRFGTPGDILAQARDNFSDLLRCLPDTAAQNRLEALRGWTEQLFAHLEPLMQARKRAGYVRECHGDLHLANLVLMNQRVRMFDCIEFNEDLRWIDVASEMAFPYTDLLAHQQPGLANWFVDELLSRSGDYQAAELLRFYAVYRALVRAKVAAIRQTQTDDSGAEALALIALAQRLAAPSPRQLLITHGLSGCGKTVASSQLLQNDHLACSLRLRSDVERKRLFGRERTSHGGAPAGMYSADAHIRTYARLHDLAEQLLRAGWSVLVDATFLKRADRQNFRTLAQRAGAAFFILAPQASPGELEQRVRQRAQQGHDPSDATLDVLARQIRQIEPLDAEELKSVRTTEELCRQRGSRQFMD